MKRGLEDPISQALSGVTQKSNAPKKQKTLNFKAVGQDEKLKRTRTEDEMYKAEKEATKAKQIEIDEKTKMIHYLRAGRTRKRKRDEAEAR